MHPRRPSSLALSTISNATSGHDTSTLAPPELQNLTPQDIDIIDAVIKRAGPAANTFFSVFKAYSDVLKERGLDPQEVVYYGKLLKLGTLRGRNWGEKWSSVRAQGQIGPPSPTDVTSQSESDAPPSFPRSRPPADPATNRQTRPTVARQQALKGQRIPRPPASSISRDGIFEEHGSFLSSTFVHNPKAKLVLGASPSEDGEMSSPVPPSYKSTAIDPPKLSQPPKPPRTDKPKPSRVDTLFSGKKIITAPKERVKQPVDLDDAWKNIKTEQDEKVADEFRDSMLLDRCWKIWCQGLQWIVTTHQQIQEARDQLLLRMYLQKWRARMAANKAREDAQVARFATRQLKRVFLVWQAKLRQKKAAAWRQEMRQKMKLVRSKMDTRIQRDTWMKWQTALLLHRAHRHYELGLLSRFLNSWRRKVIHINLLDQKAALLAQTANQRLVDRVWDKWRAIIVLHHREALMVQKVDRRVLETVFRVWTDQVIVNNEALAFQNRFVLKRALSRWKRSQLCLKNLEHKAVRYTARQDDALKRAIIRIWRARMRGIKLAHFREIGTFKTAWNKWRYRQAKEGAQLDVALTFEKQLNVRLMATVFQRWHDVQGTHRNAEAYAIEYDEAHVQARVALAWRLRLHDNLQQLKVARWGHRYFSTRRAWHIWMRAFEERKRQRKLQDFETAAVQRIFKAWKHKVDKATNFRQCEILFREHVEKRILQASLLHWTNRVIEVKSREIDVAQRADTALTRAAWTKWTASRQRHLDEISLLENYLLVKREDTLRRAFAFWLAATRASQHRRLTHQKKEARLRQMLIASAWDKWRGKFREERLRPLEYQVIVDNQRYILQRAFNIWISKADSLPAIRFHTRHLKEKLFKRWKAAMPNALKIKRAREFDRRITLARFFERWQQAYKTKTTLKAVARAKYLRLPATSTRQSTIPSRGLYHPAHRFSRRSPSPEDETSVTEQEEVPTRRPFLRTALIERSRSEKSVPRGDFNRLLIRHASPVRSVASLPTRRSPSPSSRRGPASIADTAVGSDRLWDALRRDYGTHAFVLATDFGDTATHTVWKRAEIVMAEIEDTIVVLSGCRGVAFIEFQRRDANKCEVVVYKGCLRVHYASDLDMSALGTVVLLRLFITSFCLGLVCATTWSPQILSPKKGDLWTRGSTVTVTWDTQLGKPDSVTQIKGRIALNVAQCGDLKGEGRNLAKDFDLSTGQVSFTLPSDLRLGPAFFVLFGDSDNYSEVVSIV